MVFIFLVIFHYLQCCCLSFPWLCCLYSRLHYAFRYLFYDVLILVEESLYADLSFFLHVVIVASPLYPHSSRLSWICAWTSSFVHGVPSVFFGVSYFVELQDVFPHVFLFIIDSVISIRCPSLFPYSYWFCSCSLSFCCYLFVFPRLILVSVS